MTQKRQRFAVEYVKDSNATQAAIRAGFSKKTAYSQGQRLLKDVEVQSAIERFRAPIVEEAGVTLENHLRKLAEIRDAALGAEQFGPAATAEMARGKVAGLYVDRVEDVTRLTDEQLEALARGRTPTLKIA